MKKEKRKGGPCRACANLTMRPGYIYCSNSCQMEYQFQLYIDKWKTGEELGLQTTGTVSPHIKKYLRRKYQNKCCLCGWAKINKTTGQSPLIADHVDGDWRNNIEKNLRLVCPNCDSLSSTYAALNRGNGRKSRALSNRVKEARQLKKNKPE